MNGTVWKYDNNFTRIGFEHITETHCELVDGSVLVDDVEDSVVIGEEGLVVHCPFKCGIGPLKHGRCVALKHIHIKT